MQLFKSNRGYAVGEAYELDGEIVPATNLEWHESITKLQEALKALEVYHNKNEARLRLQSWHIWIADFVCVWNFTKEDSLATQLQDNEPLTDLLYSLIKNDQSN